MQASNESRPELRNGCAGVATGVVVGIILWMVLITLFLSA